MKRNMLVSIQQSFGIIFAYKMICFLHRMWCSATKHAVCYIQTACKGHAKPMLWIRCAKYGFYEPNASLCFKRRGKNRSIRQGNMVMCVGFWNMVKPKLFGQNLFKFNFYTKKLNCMSLLKRREIFLEEIQEELLLVSQYWILMVRFFILHT